MSKTVETASNLDIDNHELANAIEDKLVPMIEQVVNQNYGLAGLSLGLVMDGEVLLAQSFGKHNLDTGEPVTARSLSARMRWFT